jgi:hypothetical protein
VLGRDLPTTAKHTAVAAAGRRGKDDRTQHILAPLNGPHEINFVLPVFPRNLRCSKRWYLVLSPTFHLTVLVLTLYVCCLKYEYLFKS